MFEDILSYSLTKSEFLEAEKLFVRNSSVFRTHMLLILAILCCVFLEIKRIDNPNFLVWDSLNRSIVSQTDEEHVLSFFLYAFSFIFLLTDIFPKYSPLWRWRIARDYKNNFIKQENKTITIDETGIKFTSDNFREVRQWQDFTKFAENKNIFLLIGQGSKVIPKRIFNSEEQISSFRTLLANKITSEKLVK